MPIKKLYRENFRFLYSFFQNQGFWMAVAMAISKLSFFAINIFIARFLSKEDLGLIFRAQNVIGFFIPFVGLGTYQGLLKFGSALSDKEAFKNLEDYSFYKGILGQFFINIVLFLFSFAIFRHEMALFQMIAWFSIRLFGLYLVEIYKASSRARFQNKSFAFQDIVVSLTTLILVLILVNVLGVSGYIAAMCIAPLSILFFGIKTINPQIKLTALPLKQLWRFNIPTAAASLLYQLFVLTDIFLISILFSENQLAEYKTASLIPFNMIFLSILFIQTDYAQLCKNHYNRKYITQYIRRFLMLFIPIAIAILGLGIYFSDYIMSIFGDKYRNATPLFNIFLVSAIVGMLIRTPFSNFLFAIAKTKAHLLISLLSVLLLGVLIWIIAPKYGLEGGAYAQALATLVSGILHASIFLYYLFKMKK